MSAIRMGRTHRVLVGLVVFGAIVIAAIGFAGSYAAVRDLALRKGFGWFANVFPLGIDAGIVVLLSLDLLLTWFRIPFPLLRQAAWVLTLATIAFNGAAAWPDPLGVGMHAVIPVLFIVSVEAARHAVGRMAEITADKHMESVRLARWVLAPFSTFRLWRRMKLWELRRYEDVVGLERDRLVYQARLRARYGRAWRRRAPVEALMPLRLARYGVPLAETAAEGYAAAGIEPPAPRTQAPALPPATATHGQSAPEPEAPAQGEPQPEPDTAPASASAYEPSYSPEPPAPTVTAPTVTAPAVTVPAGPGRRRAMGNGLANGHAAPFPHLRTAEPDQDLEPDPAALADPGPDLVPVPDFPEPPAEDLSREDLSREELYVRAFRAYAAQYGDFPNARQFGLMLADRYGITSPQGGPLAESTLRPRVRELKRSMEHDTQNVR